MTVTPVALDFASWDPAIPGVVLEGAEFAERQAQFHDRKFWGVGGVSSIYGGRAQQDIVLPVLIYETSDTPLFATAISLSQFVHGALNIDRIGDHGSLTVISESRPGVLAVPSGDYVGYNYYPDTRFDGARVIDGPKKDFAGTLGGNYWAIVAMKFTVLS